MLQEVENIAETQKWCRKDREKSFGHVKRRDHEYVGRQTPKIVLPGRRRRERSNRAVSTETRSISSTEDEVHDRTSLKLMDVDNRPDNTERWQKTDCIRNTWHWSPLH